MITKNAERNAEIVKLHRSGLSLTEVSDQFGLSVESVRIICLAADKNDIIEQSNEPQHILLKKLKSLNITQSTCSRLYNAMLRYGINSLEELSTYTYSDLLSKHGFGRTGLNALLEAQLIKP